MSGRTYAQIAARRAKLESAAQRAVAQHMSRVDAAFGDPRTLILTARRMAAKKLVLKAGPPDKARDDHGRWTAEGGPAFHGTSVEFAQKILEGGIKARQNGLTPEVWVARDKETALQYGLMRGGNAPSSRFAIVEVRVPKDRARDFQPGEFGDTRSAMVSQHNVPREWIVGYDIYRPGKLNPDDAKLVEHVDSPHFIKADTETIYLVVVDASKEQVVKAAPTTAQAQAIADALKKLLEQRAQSVDPQDIIDQMGSVAAAAGVDSLDMLGIPGGFDWSSPGDTFQRMFPDVADEVRSMIENATGTRASEMANMLVDAADPDDPRTINDIVKELRSEFEDMGRRQAETIARTETARVYGSVAQETFQRNGVDSRRWLTADDSPIADIKPVCPTCLDNAAMNWVPTDEPFSSTEGDDIDAPPAHPRCRCDCTANPRMDDGTYWLPPEESFTGDEDLLAAAVSAHRIRRTNFDANGPVLTPDDERLLDEIWSRESALAKFSEDQARDDHGRWTTEAGGDQPGRDPLTEQHFNGNYEKIYYVDSAGRMRPSSGLHDDSQPGEALAAQTQRLLGKQMDGVALAQLVGVPDGARVTISIQTENSITITAHSQDVEDMRRTVSVLDSKMDGLSPGARALLEETYPQGLSIHNDYLTLRDGAPEGLGTRILAHEIESARAAGVERITTEAAGKGYNRHEQGASVGYYVWARIGFDGQVSPVRLSPSAFETAPPSVMKIAASSVSGTERFSVQDVMAAPGGKEWWKDNGVNFGATFDLTPGSRSDRVFQSYMREKKVDITKEFDPDQARDEQGQWTADGGADPGRSSRIDRGGMTADTQASSSARGAVKLTTPEQIAVSEYVGNGMHAELNHFLRTGDVLPTGDNGHPRSPTQKYDMQIRIGSTAWELDNALAKGATEKDIVRYRGADLTGLRAGDVIHDKGYVSTTSDRETADHFVGTHRDGVLMRVTIPRGSPGLDLGGSEEEFLLPRDSNFRVTGSSKIPSTRLGRDIEVLDVEYVP